MRISKSEVLISRTRPPLWGTSILIKQCMAFAYYFRLCDYKVHIYVDLGFEQQSSMSTKEKCPASPSWKSPLDLQMLI